MTDKQQDAMGREGGSEGGEEVGRKKRLNHRRVAKAAHCQFSPLLITCFDDHAVRLGWFAASEVEACRVL